MLLLALAIARCGGPAAGAPKTLFLVPKRATLHTVADSLKAHGIITSTRRFLVTARLLGWIKPRFRGLDRHLSPGRYGFVPGEHTEKILSDMLAGNTADDYFTVPEGWDISQIAGAAATELGMDSAAFVAATRDSALRTELRIPHGVKTIEGYLFPDTYRVVFGASPKQLVEQMVAHFQMVWDTASTRRAAQLKMTRHQVVTLASIVEAEARHNSERPVIAGVYLNRLNLRHPMKLQADPTVVYALGKHVNRVLRKDLDVRSPYNTYLHYGLPPGPIDSPGRASILAVLWPAKHHFYFFVARPDGTHMFSETGKEHADSVRVARMLREEWEAAKRDSEESARRDSVAAARARRDSAAARTRTTPPPQPDSSPRPR